MGDDRLRDDWFERALAGEDAEDGDGSEGEHAGTNDDISENDDGADDGRADDDTPENDGDRTEERDDGPEVLSEIDGGDERESVGFEAFAGGDSNELEGRTEDPFELEAGRLNDEQFEANRIEDDRLVLGDDSVAAESADVGGTADDGDDSLFEQDFTEALAGVDGPGMDGPAGPDGFSDVDFGFGGASKTDFDEEFDSDLPRIDLGIDGLDRMIQGGIPERSLMVAMGSAGTGKTTFGLQFLARGLEQGENAVFITLEESRERVINSATEKGYRFDEYAEAGRLAVVDVDPIEMANSLASIRSELPALIEEFDASRLVLDSVSLLEMMYDDRAKRRNEIYDFTRSLKSAGVTSMLTSEAAEESPYASRYGIVEYLTDAIFVLQYVRPDDFRETRLAIEIQNIRDANHSRETKPYEITGEGISVYQQANLF